MLKRIWYYLRMRVSKKVRTEVGNLHRTWWSKKGAAQYPIVYVAHNSGYRSEFKFLIKDSGVDYMVCKGLLGMADLYFVNSDDWEAIAKLTDITYYQNAMWDVIYKDHNPFLKTPKDQLVA